jgi:hypothetical protein
MHVSPNVILVNIRLSDVFEVYNRIVKEMSSLSLIFNFALECPIRERPQRLLKDWN